MLYLLKIKMRYSSVELITDNPVKEYQKIKEQYGDILSYSYSPIEK